MWKSDGSKVVTGKENAQVFYEHFGNIFHHQIPLLCDHSDLLLLLLLLLINQHPDFVHLANLTTISKVCTALCQMVNGKAVGPSSITSDALKSMVWTEINPDDDHENDDANYLATVIHTMILEFWEGMLDFESWKSGTLAPVPKKGDLSNPNKWHPVCLLETHNTVIQDHRLEPQCGSLNSKGCQDAIFLLRSALQTCREHNLPSHVLFVDLIKAFDSVNHEFLWLVL